jgi:hypothetical protein
MRSAWGADPQNLPPDKLVTPEPPRPLMRELPPVEAFSFDTLGCALGGAARRINDRVRASLAIGGHLHWASQRSRHRDMPTSCCRSGRDGLGQCPAIS